MKLSIAISPCPNDTFIFYALIRGKVALPNLAFDFHFMDIEALNLSVLQGDYDLCKMSFALVPQIAADYDLLTAGSALGKGCGPLLVTAHPLPFHLEAEQAVVLPGKHTTAYFLFHHFYPQHKNITHRLFSTIENSLTTHEYDAGVIIHESRFTYMERGLSLITDLGAEWENQLQLPIPLGGIAIRKTIAEADKQRINGAIRESIAYAMQNFEETLAFCSGYAQEMSPEVMLEHIKLYVNNYSLALGDEGKNAVRKLFEVQNNENSCNFASPIRYID